MRAILEPDFRADGVLTAVTPSGVEIHLVGDPNGGWFVIEQPSLYGDHSYYSAHRINQHPAINPDIARFTALD